MSILQRTLWLALFALLAASVQAQDPNGGSGDSSDSRTHTLQDKVDKLYEKGEFERAYFIYRNELVPLGDKYAQYMVGYMHLTGMGIAEDTVAASAWYRLAAERDTPEFVSVRDQLMRDLLTEDQRRSDVLYLQLRRQYSDLVVLLASIKRAMRDLEPRTGSRLSADSSLITVTEIRSANRNRSGVDYYGGLRQQVEEQLAKLAELGDFPGLETDPDRVNIDHVERLVNERIDESLN